MIECKIVRMELIFHRLFDIEEKEEDRLLKTAGNIGTLFLLLSDRLRRMPFDLSGDEAEAFCLGLMQLSGKRTILVYFKEMQPIGITF